MNPTWGKTCADCKWNTVCTKKKVLWDGKDFVYVTACCRAMNGLTYIPDEFPEEPQDWYLWKTIRGPTIYGRSQLLPALEEDNRLDDTNTHTPSSRTTKVLRSPKAIPQRDTMARPLAGLKSVYATEQDNSQGSLF